MFSRGIYGEVTIEKMKRILFISLLIFSCENGNYDPSTLVSCFFINESDKNVIADCFMHAIDSVFDKTIEISDTILLIKERCTHSIEPYALIDSMIIINSNQTDTIGTFYPYPIDKVNWQEKWIDDYTVEWYYTFK